MAEIVERAPSDVSRQMPSTSGPTLKSGTRGLQGGFLDIDAGSKFVLPRKDIEPLGDRAGTIWMRSRPFAEADLAEIAAPPLKVTQSSKDHYRYHLIFLLEGYGNHHCTGGAFTQKPGDIVLLDTTRPCQVVSPVNVRLLRWSFPEDLLAPFLSAQVDILHLPGRQGLAAVLSRHAQELVREAERLDHGAQRGLLTHLCGLLSLAVEAQASPRPAAHRCNHRAYQRQRILSYMEAHLCDCRLTATRAASDLGISPRWLHALLEDVGNSFQDLVAGRRLAKSLSYLKDPASDHLSIAEIAFLSGFNDLSTFYRRFGERYRSTPATIRRSRWRGACGMKNGAL